MCEENFTVQACSHFVFHLSLENGGFFYHLFWGDFVKEFCKEGKSEG